MVNYTPAQLTAVKKAYPQVAGYSDEQLSAMIDQQGGAKVPAAGSSSNGDIAKGVGTAAAKWGAEKLVADSGFALPEAAGMGSSLLPAAGVAAGAYTGYQQGKGAMNAAKGKEMSTQEEVALALPTFGTSFLVDPVRNAFGGKGKDQQSRDAVRESLQKLGLIDDNYGIGLASGSTFDIGRDGGDAGYNVDFARPNASQAVGNLNPLAAILTGGDKKLTSDFAGYFSNAAMSDAVEDPSLIGKNSLAQYEKAGLNRDSALAAIKALQDGGKLSPEDAAAYANGISTLFGGGPAANASNSSSQGKGQSAPKKKRRGGATYTLPNLTPNVISAPSGTPVDTGKFASTLANIYMNQ